MSLLVGIAPGFAGHPVQPHRPPGDDAIDFPIIDLMDQAVCHHKLVGLLHPHGLACPTCQTEDHLHVHRRHRAPVLDDRCTACGRVFNAFTATRVGGHHDRIHVTVDHSGPKSTDAIDADGDGVREVHCDTLEGIWTGLRNLLRPFRGVSKWCLSQYVAMFRWGHNIKEVSDELIQVMMGIGPQTGFAS